MGKLKWAIAQKLEYRWWQLYLRNKSVDGYLSWKKAYWRQLLNRIDIDVAPDMNILDAGCGPAGIFTILPHASVTAIDPLLHKYEQLPHFDRSWYPNVRFIRTSLESMDLKQQYDLIFCINAINHVQRLGDALDQLNRHLTPGGTLILSTDVHIRRWTKLVFRALPGDLLHPQQHGASDYLRLFDQLNFIHHRTVSIEKKWPFRYCCFILQVKNRH